MHFPANRDSADAADAPWRGRQVYMGPASPGDAPMALTATGSELTFPPSSDPVNRALNRPIRWFEGDVLQRLSADETRAYIAICERRLEDSYTLLEELPAKLEAQRTLVENNRAKLAAAYAAVARVVQDDNAWLDARGFQWRPSGTIMLRSITIAPGVRVLHRQCALSDTREWKRYAALESRSKSPTSEEMQALQERDRLEQQLKDERSLQSRLESRLFDLRENLQWREREEADLLGETA